MARYILRKDGNLYNADTGYQLKKINRGRVLYYDVYVDGKQRALKADAFMIMTVYDYKDYGITIEDGINLRDMWDLHVDIVKSRFKHGDTGKRQLYRDVKAFKQKWGVTNG